jgi:hypothetical protein
MRHKQKKIIHLLALDYSHVLYVCMCVLAYLLQLGITTPGKRKEEKRKRKKKGSRGSLSEQKSPFVHAFIYPFILFGHQEFQIPVRFSSSLPPKRKKKEISKKKIRKQSSS